jgi:hypothetical protein
MCSSACFSQQRKPDRYSFSNGRAIYHWIRYFQVFHTPTTFGTGNGNEAGRIFLSGLVCLITGWMEHIMRPTPRNSVQNSGRDSRILHTDRHTDTHTQTEPTVAIRRFIHGQCSQYKNWLFAGVSIRGIVEQRKYFITSLLHHTLYLLPSEGYQSVYQCYYHSTAIYVLFNVWSVIGRFILFK